jgi:hypothetical protein
MSRLHGDVERRLDVLKWGLIPHFIKVLKSAQKPINARSENVAESGRAWHWREERRRAPPTEAVHLSYAGTAHQLATMLATIPETTLTERQAKQIMALFRVPIVWDEISVMIPRSWRPIKGGVLPSWHPAKLSLLTPGTRALLRRPQ